MTDSNDQEDGKEYRPRGRAHGKGGKSFKNKKFESQPPAPQHSQGDGLRVWLWDKAYAPSQMPGDWLRNTTAMWTIGEPPGVNVQLAVNAGRLHDSGDSITWAQREDFRATPESSSGAITAMFDMVQAKNWESVTLQGPPAFLELATREAARRGVPVTNPELQKYYDDERKRLALVMPEKPPAAPSIAPGGPRQTPAEVAAEAVKAAAAGDSKAFASIVSNADPDTRKAVSDLLHQRADRMAETTPADFDGFRARSGAQAAAGAWDTACDRAAEAEKPPAPKLEPSPRPVERVADPMADVLRPRPLAPDAPIPDGALVVRPVQPKADHDHDTSHELPEPTPR